MTIWLFVALGLVQAASTNPRPINPGAWFGINDYPSEARRAHWQGNIVAKIRVDSAGKPIECTVAQSTGHQILDDTTCALVMERGRFHPALDDAGDPVEGVFDLKMNWQLDDDESSTGAVEAGTGPLSNRTMRVEIDVDAQGQVVGCTATLEEDGDRRTDAPEACEAAASFPESTPIALKHGRPVAYHLVMTESRKVVADD